MAVFEHTYRRYDGPLTAMWSRFLVIPRYYFQDVFKSKIFTAFFVACFVYPVGCALFVYLHHNANALTVMDLSLGDLIAIDAGFFYRFVAVQGVFAFFLNLMVGPRLVSRDAANNALSLYLSRPFSRADYVLGKMSVLGILLASITLVPGLLIYAFHAFLSSPSWIVSNAWIGLALFLGTTVWIVVLSLLALAISAWVRWGLGAAAAIMGLYFIPAVLATIFNEIFHTEWASIISMGALIRTVWASLFHQSSSMELNTVAAWMGLAAVSAICLWLLSIKIRAYEVVR